MSPSHNFLIISLLFSLPRLSILFCSTSHSASPISPFIPSLLSIFCILFSIPHLISSSHPSSLQFTSLSHFSSHISFPAILLTSNHFLASFLLLLFHFLFPSHFISFNLIFSLSLHGPNPSLSLISPHLLPTKTIFFSCISPQFTLLHLTSSHIAFPHLFGPHVSNNHVSYPPISLSNHLIPLRLASDLL